MIEFEDIKSEHVGLEADGAASLRFHAIAEMFPLMEGREFDNLVADVKANGVREPVWIYEGQILDGRNRWRACEEAGVPLADRPRRPYIGDDPLRFVVSLNLHRRHLAESQRALVGRRYANMRQGERTDLEPSANLQKVSVKQAADLFNVSERSVQTAGKVLDHGAPELVRAVESGTVSVSAGAVLAERPQAEQREIVARGKKGIRQAAKEIRAKRPKKRRRVRGRGPKSQEKAQINECNIALNQIVYAAKYISSDAVAERVAAFLRDEAGAVSVFGCDAKEVAKDLRHFYVQLGKVIPAETPHEFAETAPA